MVVRAAWRDLKRHTGKGIWAVHGVRPWGRVGLLCLTLPPSYLLSFSNLII